MTKPIYRPGQTVPTSGQYGEVNTNRKPTGREVTSTTDEHSPSKIKPNYGYVINNVTKHPTHKGD